MSFAVRLTGQDEHEHGYVREFLLLVIFVGIISLTFKGVTILAFQTGSPMMGVTKDSMTHPDESWRDWYENMGYDADRFPFESGFQPGDLVILSGIDSAEQVEVGDVIIWGRSDGKRIIHRVGIKGFDSEGPYFKTRSDKYQVFDREKIRIKDIVGKVIFSIPYLGYPSNWF